MYRLGMDGYTERCLEIDHRGCSLGAPEDGLCDSNCTHAHSLKSVKSALGSPGADGHSCPPVTGGYSRLK